MSHPLAQLLAYAFFVVPLLAQTQTGLHSKFFWDAAAGERGTLIRYGNWYGPGWWGGSEKADRPGPLPPIDALDAAAQKHDFGYQIAEELGKARPDLEAHYKALADAIAVRDAMKLAEDPTLWSPPAPNPAQAKRYRERIAVGFSNYQQKLNEIKAWLPYRRPDVGDPEVLEKIWNPAPILDDKQLEALMVARVRAWNRDYEKRQANKLREGRNPVPPASDPKFASKPPLATSPAADVRVPATGAWVLEKTEFVVEKIDAVLMQKWQPSESGGDGAGSAQSTFGHPDPKVNTVIVKMSVAWTPPPRVLLPGKPIDFRITVRDGGSDDPRGLGVRGTGSLGANCPALSAVWYGPSASFNLKIGERSKEASKAYTPPSATPGTKMYIVAEYGVHTRRNQFYYTYMFTRDAGNTHAPVRASSAPPVATPSVTPHPPLVEAKNLGTWSVTFNGWAGIMEISERDGACQGRFNLRGGGWEAMLDLQIKENAISFRRTGGDQRYVGLISGSAMRGTFSQGGVGSYAWTGKKTGGPP
jgi:hypothetical protein